MRSDKVVITLWICLFFLLIFFAGEPDLQDAIIHYLMKE